MPWCDDCSKFWSPNSLSTEGDCPTCGQTIATATELAEASDYKAPWHFKLMVGLAIAYVGWRVVQMIGWVV